MITHRITALLALVVAGIMVAGCIQTPVPPATPTPTQVAVPVQTGTVPQPSFSLGNIYFQKSYAFQSEKDVVKEQFRVDNPAWGIEFTVLPLNENTIYCWFEMKVTNLDTGRSETYGYGRENGFELRHKIPMYTTGPYTIEMKGNRVKVDVTAARRNP